jgi:hypothetical protein
MANPRTIVGNVPGYPGDVVRFYVNGLQLVGESAFGAMALDAEIDADGDFQIDLEIGVSYTIEFPAGEVRSFTVPDGTTDIDITEVLSIDVDPADPTHGPIREYVDSRIGPLEDSVGDLQANVDSFETARLAAESAMQDSVDDLDARVTSVQQAQSSGRVGYRTYLELAGDLHHLAGTVGEVTHDSDPSKIGPYLKLGGLDAGSWEQTSWDRVAQVEALVATIGEQSIPVTVELSMPATTPFRNNSGSASGWTSAVGIRQHFNGTGFTTKFWDLAAQGANGRIQARRFNKTGAILLDEVVALDPTFNTVEETIVRHSLIENPEGDPLWVGFWTDGHTGTVADPNDRTYPEAEGYPPGEVSTTRSITDLTTSVVSGGRNVQFKFYFFDDENPVTAPTQPFADEVADRAGVTELAESVTANASLLAVIAETTKKVLTSTENVPLAVTAMAGLSPSSASGWGTNIGPQQNFNRLWVRPQPWDAGFIPDEFRARVYENSNIGQLLDDVYFNKTLDLNVENLVRIDLNGIIENAAGVPIFVEFFTNGKIGTRRVSQSSYFLISDGYAPGTVCTTRSTSNITSNPVSGGAGTVVWVGVELYDPDYDVAEPTDDFVNTMVEKLADAGSAVDPMANAESYGRWFMRNWRAKIAKLLYGDAGAQAVLMLFGDSWTNGQEKRATPLANLLYDAYGDAGAGYCSFRSAANGAAVQSRVTITRGGGGWAETEQTAAARGPDASHLKGSNVGATLTVAADAANEIEVFMLKQPNGGDITYAVDGGAPTTYQTANASEVFDSFLISGLADGPHSVVLTITVAGSAGCIFLGCDVRKSSAGVRVHKVACGGLAASEALQVPAQIWEDAVAALRPDAIGILLNTNDMSANVPLDTYKDQITQLVERARTAAPLADVYVMAEADNDLTGKAFTMEDYSAAMLEVAIANDCPFVDLVRFFGAQADAFARGLYENGTHPNEYGGRIIASLEFAQLLRLD